MARTIITQSEVDYMLDTYFNKNISTIKIAKKIKKSEQSVQLACRMYRSLANSDIFELNRLGDRSRHLLKLVANYYNRNNTQVEYEQMEVSGLNEHIENVKRARLSLLNSMREASDSLIALTRELDSFVSLLGGNE